MGEGSDTPRPVVGLFLLLGAFGVLWGLQWIDGVSAQSWQSLEEPVPKDVFKCEVAAWAGRIGVEPKEVHLRPMKKNQWGSASTAGRVTFNADVLSRPADFRKRVIVEELLHLKVPNHGKLFKSLLRAYLNDDMQWRRPATGGVAAGQAQSLTRARGPICPA